MKEQEFTGTLKVVVIDLLDAYHYADVFDDYRYKVISDNHTIVKTTTDMADRLFWALNPSAKNQTDWCKWDAGYDVHVYDSEGKCLYKAHDRLPK